MAGVGSSVHVAEPGTTVCRCGGRVGLPSLGGFVCDAGSSLEWRQCVAYVWSRYYGSVSTSDWSSSVGRVESEGFVRGLGLRVESGGSGVGVLSAGEGVRAEGEFGTGCRSVQGCDGAVGGFVGVVGEDGDAVLPSESGAFTLRVAHGGVPFGGEQVVGVAGAEVSPGKPLFVESEGLDVGGVSRGGAERRSVEAGVDVGLVSSGGARSKGQKKRDQLRRQRDRRRVFGADEAVSDESVVQGRCETVVSSAPVAVPAGLKAEKVAEAVPVWRRKQEGGMASVRQRALKGGSVVKEVSVGDSLVEAEKLARESLAKRRAAENAVAVRMAELKLRSLNDEKKCQDYEDLKRQRIIQWQVQALAKSQSSAKSLDPDSSVSMREFRELGKKNADLEYEKKSVHGCYQEEVW